MHPVFYLPFFVRYEEEIRITASTLCTRPASRLSKPASTLSAENHMQ